MLIRHTSIVFVSAFAGLLLIGVASAGFPALEILDQSGRDDIRVGVPVKGGVAAFGDQDEALGGEEDMDQPPDEQFDGFGADDQGKYDAPHEEAPEDFEHIAPEDLEYPIAELGNCANVEACRAYCDEQEHQSACIVFGEREGMLSEDEAERAGNFVEGIGRGGPGGCADAQTCKDYCEDLDNMRECMEFALDNDITPPEERGRSQEILNALKSGVDLPDGCNTVEACERVCSLPERMRECVDFAEAAGYMDEKDARMMRETGGRGPGDCQGQDQCMDYCEGEDNMKACMEFALRYELVPEHKVRETQQMVRAIELGAEIPDCRDPDECRVYCAQQQNAVKCAEFAVAGGFITSQQAQEAQRLLDENLLDDFPGDCRGQAECDAYCRQSENLQECTDFAVRAGYMEQQEADRLSRAVVGGPGGCQGNDECREYCEDPAHLNECLDFAVEEGSMTPQQATQLRG